MSDDEETKQVFGESTNTTAPLLLSEKVKGDISSFTFWCLRLTPESENDYNMEQIQEFLNDVSRSYVWLLCEEKSKKGVKHFHATFGMANGLDPRQDIKNWLVNIYPNKWSKADGNKRYNLKPANDNNKDNKAFIYITKDGDFIKGKGLSQDYVDYVNSKSYQKKDTRVGRLAEAKKLYVDEIYDDKQLFKIVLEVIQETSETGSVNMTYVKSFMLGAKLKKYPEYSDKLFQTLGL